MTDTISGAIEKAAAPKPSTMVRQHADSFRAVLPSHVKAATWVRLAQSALKKGKKAKDSRGRELPSTELELAANNNPGVFLASLLEAARLGLEPGTEQYYLTPRKVKGRLEILGIVGYQGYIELMYRAGAISSVVAECVYSNDSFRYQPGIDERPRHEIDWDADDRGALRLVYAYAVMKDGATSKVVVLNKSAIKKIKESAQGADTEYSPWQKHEASMWLKSAVRQLAKWVPTSAEFITTQLRAERAAEQSEPGLSVDMIEPGLPADDDDVIDGEIVDEAAPLSTDAPEPEPLTTAQERAIGVIMRRAGIADQRDSRLRVLSHAIGRTVGSTKDLTTTEASRVIEQMQQLASADLEALIASLLEEADEAALVNAHAAEEVL